MDKKEGKRSRNNKKKKSKLPIIAVIFAILLALIGFTLFKLDYIGQARLEKLVSDEVAKVSHYTTSRNYLKVNNKTISVINSKDIDLEVEYSNDILTFSKESITNSIKLDITKIKKFNDIEDIKDVDVLYIENNGFKTFETDVPENFLNYNNFTLLALGSNNSLKEINNNLKIENGRIIISSSEYALNGYIFGYFTPKDVYINEVGDDGVLNVAMGSSKELTFKITPEFATEKNVKVSSNDESIVKVNEENISKIDAQNMGDTVLNITVGNVKKEVNVHVSNYAKDIYVNVQSITIRPGKTYEINMVTIPEEAENSELAIETSNEEVVSISGNVITAESLGEATITVKTTSGDIISKEINVNVVEQKIEEIDGITYVNDILIANKTYYLPEDYNPGRLLDETMEAFNNLKTAAANEGLTFWISSGFRSYTTQQRLYANYVANYGKEAADTFSARAGHSEHQTGLAMDVNYIEDWFGDTKEGKWLAENAHKYGFIIRYPKSKEEITGYKYEPWHIRYLGVETATDVYESGLCLEEYLGITSRYSNE